VALVRSLQLGPADDAIAIGIEMPHHRAPIRAPIRAPHRTMRRVARPTMPSWMPGKPAPHAPIEMPVRSVRMPSSRWPRRHRTTRARHTGGHHGRHAGRHHGRIARRHHGTALQTLWPRRLAGSARGGSGTGLGPGLGGRLRPRPRPQQGTGDARCQAQRPGGAR
jgi:hypothetical protein